MLNIKNIYSKLLDLIGGKNPREEAGKDFFCNPEKNITKTDNLSDGEDAFIKKEIINAPQEENLTQEWLGGDEDGQLSVDVYETDKDIIIKSTIAGVKPEDLDISIHNDMLTIRGKREHEEKIEKENYFYRECYWGNFSRSIILPVDVLAEKIDATIKNGVLTVVLPKAKKTKVIKVKEIDQ